MRRVTVHEAYCDSFFLRTSTAALSSIALNGSHTSPPPRLFHLIPSYLESRWLLNSAGSHSCHECLTNNRICEIGPLKERSDLGVDMRTACLHCRLVAKKPCLVEADSRMMLDAQRQLICRKIPIAERKKLSVQKRKMTRASSNGSSVAIDKGQDTDGQSK